MIPLELLAFLSRPFGAPERRVEAVLDDLEARLSEGGGKLDAVLALTFFTDATDADEYAGWQDLLVSRIRRRFGDPPPPATVVAQPPERGRSVALEARILGGANGDLRIERRSVGGLPYTVVEGGGARQLHAGGLSSGPGRAAAAVQARAAFARMEEVLDREGLDYGHVVRQWNFIEDMLDVDASAGSTGHQRYQAFNDVRTLAYGRSGFPAGYPAATGIGQAAGGIVIEFIACEAPPAARVAPVSNPRQVDAHRYSGGVLVGEPIEEVPGNTSPKFERAKLVARDGEGVLFVSGTAAILGEASVAPGDVVAQTATTNENMAAVLPAPRLSYLRGYVKRAADIAAVRKACEEAWGRIPMLFVRSDICREELLVELEGVLVGPHFSSTES